ncbi:MAG: hypothetical protein ABMA25_00610 [Ilumatobacteraceae bacterium]
MKRKLVVPAAALIVLLGSAVALAANDSPENSNRIDVSGDTFGQFTPDAKTNPDWIQIAWQGPHGETLYVAAEMINSPDAQTKGMPAIDKTGLIVGTLEPGRGLVIDGKPAQEIDPPVTSYQTVP